MLALEPGTTEPLEVGSTAVLDVGSTVVLEFGLTAALEPGTTALEFGLTAALDVGSITALERPGCGLSGDDGSSLQAHIMATAPAATIVLNNLRFIRPRYGAQPAPLPFGSFGFSPSFQQ